MSLLSDFEDRIGGAIEGMFSGLFRSPVQPAEIARACSKEMERSRKLGVGKAYVANVYHVLLSDSDGEKLAGLIPTMESELETYLVAYARDHNYRSATKPLVRFAIDDELKLGKFEVIGEALTVDEIRNEFGQIAGITDRDDDAPARRHSFEGKVSAPSPTPHAPSPIPTPSPGPVTTVIPDGLDTFAPSQPISKVAASMPPTVVASISVPGISDVVLDPLVSYRIGRLSDCEICLEDVNASRTHATLHFDSGVWVVSDNNSTNGTFLNEKAVTTAPLTNGDVIAIGTTRITYHERLLSRGAAL